MADSARGLPVHAALAVEGASDVVVEESAIDAKVTVEDGPTIVLDLGTARWTLTFDHPAAGAYVAGRLAHFAGVEHG